MLKRNLKFGISILAQNRIATQYVKYNSLAFIPRIESSSLSKIRQR